jgi:hypothetical protein
MVEADSLTDLARISFVTRRFHELQGLGTAAYGFGLVLAVLMNHAVSSLYRPSPFQALTFANTVGVLALLSAFRLYRQTFGDPVVPPSRKILAGLLILGVMAGGAGDMWAQVNGNEGPSIMAVVLASCSIWIVARDWRWRIHYLVAAAAGLMGALVTAGVPAMADGWGRVGPPREEAYLLSYTLVGLGLVVVGLLDHRLLASSLNPKPLGARPPRAIERASNGLTRASVAAFFCVAAGVTLVAVGPAVFEPVLALTLLLAFFATSMIVMVVPQWSNYRDAAHQLVSMHRGLSVRRDPSAPRDQQTWQIGMDSLALFSAVVLAVAIDEWIMPSGAFSLLALAIAFASAWVAVRDWRYRPYYLIGAVAAAVASFLVVGMPAAKSFTVLILAVSGPLVVEGLLDYWVSVRHRSGHEPPELPDGASSL